MELAGANYEVPYVLYKEFDVYPIKVRTPLNDYTPIGGIIKSELQKITLVAE